MYQLTFNSKLCGEHGNPYEEINGVAIDWDRYDVEIQGYDTKTASGVEFPTHFSNRSRSIVWNQYFKETPTGRETSLRQVVDRVADTISAWGELDGYFDKDTRVIFNKELKAILIGQYATFNSPVWYNVGLLPHPQCSACFIQSVDDSLESLMELARTEVLLFKGGSGTGTNLSSLRASGECLSNGGTASGPVSFMKGFDAFAGVIQSGGRTRRAAKMVILDHDHPDIMAFITCKADADRDAKALMATATRDPNLPWSDPRGAYQNVPFQNANNSVRVSDEFMCKAILESGEDYQAHYVNQTGSKTLNAREVLMAISEATWSCGDPGLQFHDTINRWNTCSASGKIRASNPCSEYMFLDDSACNLASLRLTKFLSEEGIFDIKLYAHVIQIMMTAMDIIVDRSSYPTLRIEENSRRFRPLGLGICDLGAMLMQHGVPYDSSIGRSVAGSVQAILQGVAMKHTAMLARVKGPFSEYELNAEPYLSVMACHKNAASRLESIEGSTDALVREALSALAEGYTSVETYGARNAQLTVAAPTGTISFMLGADTTGIEPAIALVSDKHLAHGSTIRMVTESVENGVRSLGLNTESCDLVLKYLKDNGNLDECPYLTEDEKAVFDTAYPNPGGTRHLSPRAHIQMMAALQPFISGAISKTVNMPSTATVEEIFDTYVYAWENGLKAVAIYRDGSKGVQPINVKKVLDETDIGKVVRRRLQDTRKSLTHKFCVGSHEGYITVGLYEDGMPGEVFITISKEGSVVSGMMDAFATAISLNLQYGVPLEVLVKKFSHMRFEPSGFTNNKQIPIAKSIVDYIFQWLANQFLSNGKSVGDQPELETAIQDDMFLCPACGATGRKFGCSCANCGDSTSCG